MQLAGGDHQVGGRQRQLLAQGARRVIQGEVGRRDAAAFHPHCRQGIAIGHRHRGAGGGGQVQRADLPIHTRLQHHIAAEGQGRVGTTDDGDPSGALRFRCGSTSQFRGFAAVGEQQANVLRGNHTEIAMQGIGGVEEQGHQPDRGEGGGDLAGDDAAFADSADHQLRFAISTVSSTIRAAHLIAVQPLRRGSDGGGFLLQTASESGQRRDP